MLIEDAALKKALLAALADETSAQILAATAYEPKSVPDLIHEKGLPSSSAYRHVHDLENNRLLLVAKTVVMSDGKSFKMYRATFREVSVSFEAGRVTVTGTPTADAVQRAFRLFHSFTEDR